MKKQILFFLAIFSCATFVRAVDGELDLTFNPSSEGTPSSRAGVHFNFFVPPVTPAEGPGFATQAFARLSGVKIVGDKIVASGHMKTPVAAVNNVGLAARFNKDGTLDTSFNGTGFVTTAFSDDAQPPPTGGSVVVQSDGKVIIMVRIDDPSPEVIGLARFTSSGVLDPTFGTSGTGRIEINFTGSDDIAEEIALQSDDKILIVGRSSATPDDIFVARLDANGALDTTFGGGAGFVTPTTDMPAVGHRGTDVIQLSDGKLLVAGSYSPAGTFNALIIRLNANGDVDSTFNGNTGFVRETFDVAGTVSGGSKLIVQDDGKIIMVGEFNAKPAIARFSSEGARDTTFGTSGPNFTLGTAMPTFGFFTGVLQRDGKVVATAPDDTFGASGDGVILARFTESGAFDPDFGTAGIALFNLDQTTGNEETYDLGIQSDGGIIAVGNGLSYIGLVAGGARRTAGYVARFTAPSVSSSVSPSAQLLTIKYQNVIN